MIQRSEVLLPPLLMAVKTWPFGRAALVLYQRASCMFGGALQVLMRQSKMLLSIVVLRPPLTTTRPSFSKARRRRRCHAASY